MKVRGAVSPKQVAPLMPRQLQQREKFPKQVKVRGLLPRVAPNPFDPLPLLHQRTWHSARKPQPMNLYVLRQVAFDPQQRALRLNRPV